LQSTEALVIEAPIEVAPAETTAIPAPKAEPAAIEQAALSEAAMTAVTPTAPQEVVPVSKPEPESSAPTAVVPALSAPTVDIVRIPPEGISTVAGRADADVDILIFVDGVEVARAKTGASGDYVALFDIPAVDRPREMQIAAQKGGSRVFASSSIVIAPFVPVPEPKPAEALSDTAVAVLDAVDTTIDVAQDNSTAKTTAKTTPVIQPDGTDAVTEDADVAMAKNEAQVVSQPVEVIVQNEAPVAPTVLVADDTGVKILQSATPITGVSIDAITYDPDGAVFSSGRGTAGTTVRLYLNTTALMDTLVGADGQWRAKMDVAAGIYSLRADMVDEAGKVLSRVEIPFKREDVAVLERLAQGATQSAQPTGNQNASTQNNTVETGAQDGAAQASTAETATQDAPQPRISSVTVQPGNTLWGIASESYGDGFLFARVFNANVAQIRDPDLIYPGQVFVLPDE
jgi:hypothetical protein